MEQHSYDFLILGSGISGLNFALEVAEQGTVAIVTKKELMESNSNYAQGGIAAVLDAHDSFDSHIKDTIDAGGGINDREAVEMMVREAPAAIQKLIDIGVGFSRQEGTIELTQEGGHSHRRIAHTNDATGKEIERALLHHVRNHSNITTYESHIGIDLLIEDGHSIGASVYDSEKKILEHFHAKATILATGGAGQVYARNSNPKVTTGDGIAMAQRAGATIRDMEFIQFHPTALALDDKPAFLISETVRGEGGILTNNAGEEFMEKYDDRQELAPRDIVSRAIYDELKKGPVYLDISHKEEGWVKKRFPYIYERLWWFDIKMDEEKIPVAPAAHYTCGGIHTDLDGKTNVPGLFAFGEVAHTGVHGANRLASNSLLECMVFSRRAAKAATIYAQKTSLKAKKGESAKDLEADKGETASLRKQITDLMWDHVGIIRTQTRLKEALAQLSSLANTVEKLFDNNTSRETIELRNLHTVALLITEAALARKESIGAHYIKESEAL